MTMTYREFVRLVSDMRQAQKRWFRDRNPADLEASKRLEREADRAIAAYHAPATLFPEER